MASSGLTSQGHPSDLLLRDSAVLREVLEGDISRIDTVSRRSFLILLAGLPGTGKTHFARELANRVPLLILESDRLRKVLAPQPGYTPAESARLFGACHLLIEEYVAQGHRVLFDATNLTEKFRRPLYQIARRASCPLVLVRFTAPREMVRRRLAERVAGVHPEDYSDAGWQIYCRMAPHEEAVKRQHFDVDTSHETGTVLEQVVRLLRAGDGAVRAGPQ